MTLNWSEIFGTDLWNAQFRKISQCSVRNTFEKMLISNTCFTARFRLDHIVFYSSLPLDGKCKIKIDRTTMGWDFDLNYRVFQGSSYGISNVHVILHSKVSPIWFPRICWLKRHSYTSDRFTGKNPVKNRYTTVLVRPVNGVRIRVVSYAIDSSHLFACRDRFRLHTHVEMDDSGEIDVLF